MQHHYLAFVTLAFTTLVFLVLRNEEWLTGGIYGISNIPRPACFGCSPTGRSTSTIFCLGVLALVSLAAWWLIRSPWGRAFMALRENPIRAALARRRHAALHADGVRHRLGLGGISGVLYAPLVAVHRADAVRARAVARICC